LALSLEILKSLLAKEKLPHCPSSSLFKMCLNVGDAKFNERAIVKIENEVKEEITF